MSKYELGKYNISALRRVMDYCRAFDVKSEMGGIFDARCGAVNIYSRPWKNHEEQMKSMLVGTFWIDWSNGSIEIEEEGTASLTKWIFQYLYDGAEAGHMDRFSFKDDPYWMFREEIIAAEPELAQREKERLG